MKKWSVILMAIALVLSITFLAGCSKTDSNTVKIGVIAELTGDIPAVGASCKNAAELAVAEINDAGGIQLGDKKFKV